MTRPLRVTVHHRDLRRTEGRAVREEVADLTVTEQGGDLVVQIGFPRSQFLNVDGPCYTGPDTVIPLAVLIDGILGEIRDRIIPPEVS